MYRAVKNYNNPNSTGMHLQLPASGLSGIFPYSVCVPFPCSEKQYTGMYITDTTLPFIVGREGGFFISTWKPFMSLFIRNRFKYLTYTSSCPPQQIHARRRTPNRKYLPPSSLAKNFQDAETFGLCSIRLCFGAVGLKQIRILIFTSKWIRIRTRI
jgi:hypothetical protein